MKTLRALLLLSMMLFSSWAAAAFYLVCVSGNGTSCNSGSNVYSWQVVGHVPVVGSLYAGNSQLNGLGTVVTQPRTFVGTFNYSHQCSIDPGVYVSGAMAALCTNAGGTYSLTSMLVASYVSCIPSARTIDPCPSGYAPSSVTSDTWVVGDSYSSAFEKLPIQDLIYAACVTVCGLLGIAVGTRLL